MSGSSSINYFNNIFTNQLLQQQFNNTIAQNNSQIQQNNQNTSQLGSAINSLSNLLASSNKTSAASSYQLSSLDAYTMNKLKSQGADKVKLDDLIGILSGDTDDLLYTRTPSNDPNITSTNKSPVFGADVSKLLAQASQVAQRGDDVNLYLDTAKEIAEKGDYDDLRRFINVTSTVMNTKQPLNSYYSFAKDILNKRSYDFESNVFSLQTLLAYGTNMDTATKIMKNMETTGMTGRNNLVDLHRVIVNEKDKTGNSNLASFLSDMAASGDTRAFLDKYMEKNGIKTTAPDFTKFDRIERIDGEDMVITEGESAALFAQAISQQKGLLDKSVMYWSSLQTGAMDHGDNYLDLSKLKAGTYDIYVKIGNFAGGTDTAKKRVVVLPKDEVYVDGGGKDCNDDDHDDDKVKDKEKNNNGLGDTKDDDNEVKFEDYSNPGHNKVENNKSYDDNKIKNNESNDNCEKVATNKDKEDEDNKNKVSYNSNNYTDKEGESKKDSSEVSFVTKVETKKPTSSKKKLENDDLDFICNRPIVKNQIVRALNSENKELAEKYKEKKVQLMDILTLSDYKKEREKVCNALKGCLTKDSLSASLKLRNVDDEGVKKACEIMNFIPNQTVQEVNPDKK
ncbi:MAG: hypothetical protein U0457_06060 [Candidatus Sericytochromatia bacterium]